MGKKALSIDEFIGLARISQSVNSIKNCSSTCIGLPGAVIVITLVYGS